MLDYGGRHPDMPKRHENCFILTCNFSEEMERLVTAVTSKFI